MDPDSTSVNKKTIFIAGLNPSTTTESVLLEAFVTFGDIISIRMPKQNDQGRGFAFIEFATVQDAKDARDNMDLNVLGGNILSVREAQPDKRIAAPKDERGFDRPVWESEAWLAQHAKPLDQSGGARPRAATPPSAPGGASRDD